MKEIIEKILDAEKSARERVEKAREKAKEIRLKAEKDAGAIISKARDKGHREAKVLLENTEKDTQKEKAQALQMAAQSRDSVLTGDEKKVEDTLDGLLQIVLGKEYPLK